MASHIAPLGRRKEGVYRAYSTDAQRPQRCEGAARGIRINLPGN
jgi:hypothetical protein